ncbi:hypothetical protein Pelo_2937 [Pelomyxa schiedti]|nr:hypothetical protein Pelo_2937 [Pelomyxa schiedti]
MGDNSGGEKVTRVRGVPGGYCGRVLVGFADGLRPATYQDEDWSVTRMIVFGFVIIVLAAAVIILGVYRANHRGVIVTTEISPTLERIRQLDEGSDVQSLSCTCTKSLNYVYEMLEQSGVQPDYTPFSTSFVAACIALSPSTPNIESMCQYVMGHVMCQYMRVYTTHLPQFSIFKSELEIGFNRSCFFMSIEAFHLWRHMDSYLDAAFNSTTMVSDPTDSTSTPLWGDTSSTSQSRQEIWNWANSLAGLVLPSLVMYQPDSLCSTPPIAPYDAWYSTLYNLCQVQTCQWVGLESGLDVFLWVFAVMGTVLTVVLVLGALLYNFIGEIQGCRAKRNASTNNGNSPSPTPVVESPSLTETEAKQRRTSKRSSSSKSKHSTKKTDEECVQLDPL